MPRKELTKQELLERKLRRNAVCLAGYYRRKANGGPAPTQSQIRESLKVQAVAGSTRHLPAGTPSRDVAPIMPFVSAEPGLSQEAEQAIAAMHNRFLTLFINAPSAPRVRLQHGLHAGQLASIRLEREHLLLVAETDSDRLRLAQLDQQIAHLETLLGFPAAA